MDKLTTTLLAGAAVSAIAAVPAMAAPMPVAKSALQYNYSLHQKTNVHNPSNNSTATLATYTFTVTAAHTVLASTYHVLGGVAWVTNGGNPKSKCKDFPGQAITFSKVVGLKAKVKKGTLVQSSGTLTSGGKQYCKNNPKFKFYGPNYLLKKSAKGQDKFDEKDTITTGGNNYVLLAHWTVNAT